MQKRFFLVITVSGISLEGAMLSKQHRMRPYINKVTMIVNECSEMVSAPLIWLAELRYCCAFLVINAQTREYEFQS